MILLPPELGRPDPREETPWSDLPLGDLVFLSLWTTGPDPTVDSVVRLLAFRLASAPGASDRFDQACGAENLEEVWIQFERFLGRGPLLVPDLAEFMAWRTHATGRNLDREDVIGLDELANLLLPGSNFLRRAVERHGRSWRSIQPEEVRELATSIVNGFLDQGPETIAFATSGYLRAWRGLEAGSPRAARILRLALALADRPGEWALTNEGHGPLTRPLARGTNPEDRIAELQPACERESAAWRELDTVPVQTDGPAPFAEEDRAALERIFEDLLPASFAVESGSPGRSSYRAGQHEVARAVADVLGTGELLLVHAPTGTGKTLAYLVPALLWARRHGVRIGIATYTRALQQQAMDREMPRALAALAAADIQPPPRVALLKGRENYLCWRALKLAAPEEEADGAGWLGWTSVALFGLRDPEGDLDRLPLRPPVPMESVAPWRRRFTELLRHVRCRSACCSHEEDRRGCAAEVARKRSERSHLVVTNHAFALARQEFFKHIVFDECEHLHDQAHGAWSHVLSFRQMRGTLSRLHGAERGGPTAVLDRIRRALIEDSPLDRVVASALSQWRGADEALLRLEASIESFEAWREAESRLREERESHSLLREYVESAEGEALLQSRTDLCRLLNDLEATLADVSERLESAPLRSKPGVRRSLDISRTEISGMLEAIEAWLPIEEGRPAFRPSFFYDVEVEPFSKHGPRGGRVLAARVLLPNEVLGRNYYPGLASGIFVSATTWLRGSFEPALGYLGLDRAAEPAPDEDRPPRIVRTFRAPEVFDYSRVLVAVPRDAPPLVRDKEAFLDYVRRFVGHLGERTRGRMLVLFTNAQDVRRVGSELEGFFRARSISLWFQNMESASKEELSDLFRARVDSVLLGVDTFWFGADFPGDTLQYLVIVRLPYGVPDRYHHAQCAALGTSEQRNRIYMPRALAKFRQGFGRLMRRESDLGCVFVLDGRALEPKHRAFLRELPIGHDSDAGDGDPDGNGARLVRGDTERCLSEALAHMDLLADLRRRGLSVGFGAEEP
ncbi:MAG: helicase C-terminal domain-containing protein [Planctomycetota bacterium]